MGNLGTHSVGSCATVSSSDAGLARAGRQRDFVRLVHHWVVLRTNQVHTRAMSEVQGRAGRAALRDDKSDAPKTPAHAPALPHGRVPVCVIGTHYCTASANYGGSTLQLRAAFSFDLASRLLVFNPENWILEEAPLNS